MARELSLFLCGDVMLGRGVDQILSAPCDPTIHESYLHDARDYVELAERKSGAIPRGVDAAYPWGDALALLEEAHPDARIINLETSITRSEDFDPDKGINYRMSPENATTLAAAKIDVCTLANNHVLDWGERGLVETLDTLDRLGVRHCGAGRDEAEALRPAVIDLGERGRVAVFGLGAVDSGVPPTWQASTGQPGINVVEVFDAARVCRTIDAWRDERTTIVVSIHWGGNWDFGVPRAHRRFAHELIECGAHVIHGHSSHHVKGIEVHRGQLILYGCGDLLTDYEGIGGHERFRGDLGILYLATLDLAGALTRLEMVPMRMQKLQLRRAPTDDARWLAATLSRCGQELGTTVTGDDRLRLAW